jgi:hypothetical protein
VMSSLSLNTAIVAVMAFCVEYKLLSLGFLNFRSLRLLINARDANVGLPNDSLFSRIQTFLLLFLFGSCAKQKSG